MTLLGSFWNLRISYDHENHLPGFIVLNSNKLQIWCLYKTVTIIVHLWESNGSTFIVGNSLRPTIYGPNTGQKVPRNGQNSGVNICPKKPKPFPSRKETFPQAQQ